MALQTPSGPRDLYRVVSSGASFGSNPLRQEIGLGDATSVISVEIRWPGSNQLELLKGLQMDHGYEIKEGDPGLLPMKLKRLNFRSPVTAQVRSMVTDQP